jgi:N-acyl amino acid synthase of PEP-CTERM/exosortase system
MTTPDIAATFHHFFKLVLADTAVLRNEVYRIRYQVYCQELHYEDAKAFPDGLEHDIYDDRSRHCLLLHRDSNTYAGCVRLVFNDNHDSSRILPFEAFCASSLHRDALDPGALDRASFGEISRLAVPAKFRRRKKDLESPVGEISDPNPEDSEDKRHFPSIALGLYLAAASIGLHAGLEGVFAMMEPRLARHLMRFGIQFQQIGDVVNYHGPRAAFYINRNMLFKKLRPEVLELLDTVRSDLDTGVRH